MYNSQACPARWSRTRLGLFVFAAVLCVHSRAARATSVIPISDAELYRRADLVLHGIVLSSEVAEDPFGRPETVTVIQPLSTMKGGVSGPLVVHQVGGTLPDGRFLKMWGAPEYKAGREVVVFAIARPDGDYETAEMLLGKFEVSQDELGNRYAVPELASGVKPGLDVYADEEAAAAGMAGIASGARRPAARAPGIATLEEASALRPLAAFLSALRRGDFTNFRTVSAPAGRLTPVDHPEKVTLGKLPQWGHINGVMFRWNNNATATWTISGTANITGGGTAEATGALAMWTNDPFSSINYVAGSGSSNVMYMNATSSALGCGWSSCLSGGGVIGCGGPSGGGNNSWRGDTYATIGGGTVELRAFCNPNAFSSTIVQSVLEHELGHTLGLGHSDQNVSSHDTCRGDEDAAIMRSSAQNRSTIGTDDQDAIRWVYGDGGNSCSGPAAPVISSISPSSGITAGGTALTISGGGFQSGATVTLGGSPLASMTIVNATTIYATTAAHAAGAVSLVITNPDTQSGSGGFSYVPQLANGADMDANGRTDLIWRNQSNGTNSIWLMNGTTATSVASLTTVDPSWKLAGAGDFNADGKADLVWRNETSGLNSIWLMNGTTVSSVVGLTTVTDTNWKIVGVGDFNGDGKADLVWRNVVNGLNSVWLMNGTAFSSIAGLPTVTDTNWKIVGVGNMDGVGGPDLVWRNPTNGLNSVWFMNGTSMTSIAGLPTVNDPTWEIAGVGDFNADGKSDLIWRNNANGLNAIWLMNGGTATAVVSLPTLSDTNWKVGAPH